MNHPVIRLTEQFRYRPVYAIWSNCRTYGQMLQSHESTNVIVSPRFLDARREVYSLDRKEDIDLGNIVVSVAAPSVENVEFGAWPPV